MRAGFVMRLVLAGACTSACAGSARAQGPDPSAYGREVQQAYQKVRAATDRYHSLDAAVKDGYPATVADCLSDEMHGAMGYHHVNRALVDAKLEIDKPEILLYEKRADGSYRLNGVEYIVPYRLWPADSTPPKIMGRELYKSDDLKLWYTHMWVWTPNSAGLFANYNPAVACRS